MKSYFIFAIALTVVYVLYFVVVLVQDFYGKKGSGKANEEVFDLGPLDDEESIVVRERETGFDVGKDTYETENRLSDSSAEPETDTDNAAVSAEEKFERLKAKAEERMEESVPYLSDERTAEEMYKAMIARGRMDDRPEMTWTPVNDRL